MASTTRVRPVAPGEAGLLTRLSYWYSKRRFGAVPEPFAVTANHPKLLFATAVHEMAVQWATTALPTQPPDFRPG
jgi:hypothetical protein